MKMYNDSYLYPFPYPNYMNAQRNNYSSQSRNWVANGMYPLRFSNESTDYGSTPFVININEAAKQNNTFRTALWTGTKLQLTLMSLNVGEDIGLEMHPNVDQFLRIEQGQGIVQMGKTRENLSYRWEVYDDSAIFIPAGTWHNLTNTGTAPLKIYSIYAPPNHPFGTVHATKADAEDSHGNRYRNGSINRVTNSANAKTAFTKEEAAAIALLLGIDFNKTKFDLNEFWMGVNTELEHGRKYNQTNVTADDPITTGKIALAHLSEFPDYYQRLKKLEEEAKAYWNK